jgi:hypothetical protein
MHYPEIEVGRDDSGHLGYIFKTTVKIISTMTSYDLALEFVEKKPVDLNLIVASGFIQTTYLVKEVDRMVKET